VAYLTNDNGIGILVTGDPLICFAALIIFMMILNLPGNYQNTEKMRKPQILIQLMLKPRDLVNLNVDLGQMGVGGDNSWGALIHTKYRLLDKKYEYSFRIRPVIKDDDILKLAKEKF